MNRFIDACSIAGNNYYRILSLDKYEKTTYSQVAKIFMRNAGSQFSVYPNPLQGDNLNLQFWYQPAGTYQVRLLNSSGQLMMANEIDHQSGNSTETIQLNNNMAHGIYQLEIIKPGGEKSVIKVRK